jgi:hypothetical protein
MTATTAADATRRLGVAPMLMATFSRGADFLNHVEYPAAIVIIEWNNSVLIPLIPDDTARDAHSKVFFDQ